MGSLRVLFGVLLASLLAFAQSDRGTVTGTVSDTSGAVIPGVSIVATNVETSARYETASTETGNYTLAQLPSGLYQLSAELPGFKKYVRQLGSQQSYDQIRRGDDRERLPLLQRDLLSGSNAL